MRSDPVNGAGGVAERAFFREEFQRRTVVIAWRSGPVATAVPVIRELLAGDSRVIAVVAGPADPSVRDDGAATTELAAALGGVPVPEPTTDAALAEVWTDLVDTGSRVVAVDDDPARAAAALAGRLGVFKLVVTDEAGGWGRSFATFDDLADGATDRPEVAAAVRRALDAGVVGVNVCRAGDLDTELFTFDGAGTLFTADPYVVVDRLRADDLSVVEQLVARGVAEGFLRPRPRAEVVRLALGGLGARVGFDRHLAGFGTLEIDRYPGAGLAEVTCLYTLNRYSGEGVGGRLVDGLVDRARQAGMHAVFACTVSDRAAALFRRSGFDDVALDRLPPEKWHGYDTERRRVLSAHWFDLDATDAAGPGTAHQ